MSASLLREAAAKMRTEAEAARLWEFEDGSKRAVGWHDVEELSGHPFDHAHAVFIASWYPAVALAIADWLENSAESLEAWGEIGVADLSVADMYAHEIKVATAYLGSADD